MRKEMSVNRVSVNQRTFAIIMKVGQYGPYQEERILNEIVDEFGITKRVAKRNYADACDMVQYACKEEIDRFIADAACVYDSIIYGPNSTNQERLTAQKYKSQLLGLERPAGINISGNILVDVDQQRQVLADEESIKMLAKADDHVASQNIVDASRVCSLN